MFRSMAGLNPHTSTVHNVTKNLLNRLSSITEMDYDQGTE